MDRKKFELWELKEGQYILVQFKVEGKDKDLSLIVCKVKAIHADAVYVERTTAIDGVPITAVLFNTGYGMRDGLDDIRLYEIFESSEKEYLTELI